MNGAERIADERIRQGNIGLSADHDDEHTAGDLSVVAAFLAIEGTDATIDDPLERDGSWGLIKKHKGDRIRQLEIAGALIAAEIDRLLRRDEKRD